MYEEVQADSRADDRNKHDRLASNGIRQCWHDQGTHRADENNGSEHQARLFEGQVQVVDQVARQQGAQHDKTGVPAQHSQHVQRDVSVLEDVAPLMLRRIMSRRVQSSDRWCRVAEHSIQQARNDQA